MDLINRLPHKRNTSVKVNGTKYDIDGSGIVRGVSDTDAAKLQSSGDYKLHIERTPVSTAPVAPVAEETQLSIPVVIDELPPAEPHDEPIEHEPIDLPEIEHAPPAETHQAEAKKKGRKAK